MLRQSKRILAWVIAGLVLLLVAVPTMAQLLTGPPANPQYKYSTPMPPGIAISDKIETRLGPLSFFDGFPEKATAEKLWDNLDFQRAVQNIFPDRLVAARRQHYIPPPYDPFRR